jgi:hypothetical protein
MLFREGYDTAYITPPIHYDTCGPTIFTMCIFWAQAARGAPDTWKVPVVRLLPFFVSRICADIPSTQSDVQCAAYAADAQESYRTAMVRV